MKYVVCFKKYEAYEVEADNPQEAEDIACVLCDADAYAWEGSPYEIDIQEIE